MPRSEGNIFVRTNILVAESFLGDSAALVTVNVENFFSRDEDGPHPSPSSPKMTECNFYY